MLREPLQRALRISDFFVSMSLKRQKLLLATVVYDNIPLFLPADKIRERLDKILDFKQLTTPCYASNVRLQNFLQNNIY